MPISLIAQSPTTSSSHEKEPTPKPVALKPDENGVFSHVLLGGITLDKVEEVKDGATITIHFGDFGTFDIWPCGNQKGSFLVQAVFQEAECANANGGQFPLDFPKTIDLTKAFLRQDTPPQQLSIMQQNPDGSWQELSKVELSYSQWKSAKLALWNCPSPRQPLPRSQLLPSRLKNLFLFF